MLTLKPKTLLIVAGAVWTIAGANVAHIGIATWKDATQSPWIMASETILVFLLFFGVIFRKVYLRNSARISAMQKPGHILSFFDRRGWIIMGGMIALGLVVRKFELAPPAFIATFYIGLGTALLLTGLRFGLRALHFRKNTEN